MRLNDFDRNARYTIEISRPNASGEILESAGWVNSQDTQVGMQPVLVYNGDVLTINIAPAAIGRNICIIERLNSGSWVDAIAVNVPARLDKFRITLTVGGNATTSTVSVANSGIF